MASLDWCRTRAAEMARDGRPLDAVGYLLERFSFSTSLEQELTRLAFRHECDALAQMIEGLA